MLRLIYIETHTRIGAFAQQHNTNTHYITQSAHNHPSPQWQIHFVFRWAARCLMQESDEMSENHSLPVCVSHISRKVFWPGAPPSLVLIRWPTLGRGRLDFECISNKAAPMFQPQLSSLHSERGKWVQVICSWLNVHNMWCDCLYEIMIFITVICLQGYLHSEKLI